MINVTVEKNKYTVSSAYQWDLNQDLVISGLSIPVIPEIHFTNEVMDRAIVRQATMSADGVIRVDVPNSLFQQPYDILAYVCRHDGDSFKSLYQITIPVTPRGRPNDYKVEADDEEIYSFNALENKLENVLAVSLERYDQACEALEQAIEKYNEALSLLEQN